MINDPPKLSRTFLGYLPKRRTPRPAWLAAPDVEEICSVSDCEAGRPEGWVDLWKHNDFGMYDTVEIARSIIPTFEKPHFLIYGYFILGISCIDGASSPLNIKEPAASPLVGDWDFLGFDVVSGALPGWFECSALSCNHWAESAAVNQFCLFPKLDDALKVAAECEGAGAEPGPYHVLEVWREKKF